MAGSGYKVFTAGDVLTAADVQGHLQDQAVMRFADSTARATSIGTANFTEGMVSYLDNTNQVEYYDGSTWGSIAPVSNSGLTLLNTTSFSGVASQSVNNVFSATYRNYRVIINITGASTSTNLRPRFRASGVDSSASYYHVMSFIVSGSGSLTVQQSQNINDMVLGDYDTTSQMITVMDICNVFTSSKTSFNYQTAMNHSTNARSFVGAGMHDVASSFDGMTILAQTGTITGSVSVYGYNV
jgi:hypothetical protein